MDLVWPWKPSTRSERVLAPPLVAWRDARWMSLSVMLRLANKFGRLLVEHQLIQEKLADMSTELDAARLLVYRAAYLKDTTSARVTREAESGKVGMRQRAAGRIVDSAVQIHGGTGLVRGSIVERLYRDVRALRIYEGYVRDSKDSDRQSTAERRVKRSLPSNHEATLAGH